jgi:hypothetical protein
MIDETKNVPYDYIQPYELSGEQGDRFSIEIKTDGAPIDILILDTENFTKYNKSFTNDVYGNWNGVINRDIVSKEFSFSLPTSGTYYLRFRQVLENSQFTSNGADAKRSVNVAIRIK